MVQFKNLIANFGRLLVGLLFLLIGVMPSTAQATTENWTLIGQFGGKTQAITTKNGIIYAGIGSRLAIFNSTNLANPTIQGMSAPFSDFVQDIVVDGSHAYIAAGGAGVGIIDITNPVSPLVIGTQNLRGYAEGIAEKGSIIYLADGPYGLRILDANNPSNPTEVGNAFPFNYAFDVALAGNYAYIAAGGSGLLVADISDPHHPIEIGQLDTPGYAYEIAISGNTVYIADAWEGVEVVDISNPAHPVLQGKASTPGWALSVASSGTILYVGDGDAGLRVLDVSNKTAPRDLGSSIGDDGFARRVTSDGQMVYVADVVKGVRVINAAILTQLQQLGIYSQMAEARRVTVVGNYAYVAAGQDGGMYILNVADPSNPVRVGLFATDGYASGVAISGSYAYLTTMNPPVYDISVVNIANPTQPVFVGGETSASLAPNFGSPRDIVIQGNMAYVADEQGLRIYDISIPASIHLEGRILTSSDMSGAIEVAVMGNYAYVADAMNGVRIVNIADPAHPQLIKTFNTSGFSQAVFALNNRLYVSNGSLIQVLDVSNPAVPVEIGHYDTPGSSYGLALSGNELIVSDGGGGVQVLDVSDPAHITLTASLETLGFAWQTFLSGNTLYSADGNGGLMIFQKQVTAKASGKTQASFVQRAGGHPTGMETPIYEDILFRQTESIISKSSPYLTIDRLSNASSKNNTLSTNNGCFVTTTADSGSGCLRQCMTDATSGTVITFSTTVFPPGNPATIHVTSPLPLLDKGWVTIDGSNAGVIIDGGKSVAVGLHITSSHNTIMGVQINHFVNDGLFLNLDGQYNQIGGDHTLGTGPSGQGNVFAGNGYAIDVAHTSYNTFKGNFVGTNASGTASSSDQNQNGFVLREYAFYNQIGGLAPGERNIISGNSWRGINIFGNYDSWNVVIGNYIGTDITGSKPISNNFAGIAVEAGASNNIIGGRTPAERNVISGNIGFGILISDPNSTQNTVIGNIIGLDATGTVALPNGTGILVWNTGFNRIGGSMPGEGNLVSGNSNVGIGVGGIGQTDTIVMGNRIGGDLYGHSTPGNSMGINITEGTLHNFIGGLSTNEGNRIDHNRTGIDLTNAGIKYNWVAGNIITGHPETGIYLGGYASDNFIVRNYLTDNNPGIWVSEGAYNTLRANAITKNQSLGIRLTGGGNQMIAAPVITQLTESHIGGQACPGCVVEIFSDPGDQGFRYEGSTIADQAGNFQYAKRLYGPNVTATSTDSAGNTSQFSSPSAIYWSWINIYLPLIKQSFP